MSLTREDVERLLRLLDASKFDELHLEIDGTTMTLRRGGAGTTTPPPATPVSPSSPSAPTVLPAGASSEAPQSGLSDIRTTLLGTFYGRPKPGAEPFVSVGSQVRRDTVVGIIEVMKLMNSITANVEGEIVEILVRDGELVEYDQVLIRVRPVPASVS